MSREWLVKLRNNAEKTHEEVAKEVEISRQYYGMIEAELRNPSVDLAKRIANALKFDWTIFFVNKENESLRKEQSSTKEVI
ncbi:helix-turn-helix transcriptional regulator [Paenibacillus monticola]|uniref:Helix-turn-helix domain-containing protein n=1 Tax=Paenibacillus monticola TaxID=2666075 RepID=A0A7X2HB83_9BACL|nr:helix-turn-helix transcriptional regulator [Paenibacillus monticola]MRN56791.1 helix-turn-helix domain-containing protein [Paenibacillus monticola]